MPSQSQVTTTAALWIRWEEKLKSSGSCLQALGSLGSAAKTQQDLTCAFGMFLLPAHACGWGTEVRLDGGRRVWQLERGPGTSPPSSAGSRARLGPSDKRDCAFLGQERAGPLLVFGFPCARHLSGALESSRSQKYLLTPPICLSPYFDCCGNQISACRCPRF